MGHPNAPALAGRPGLILGEPGGHARSESPADPGKVTFGHWVLDLRDLMSHLGLVHAVVGGLSLGAGIATRFALAHPERVRALVVVDSSSAAGLPLSVENLVMRAKSIEVTLKGGMNAMAEFAIASNPNAEGPLHLEPVARHASSDFSRKLN